MNDAQSAMPPENHCPQCGKPLASGALTGLCPACLLKQGVAGDTVTGAMAFTPPTVEELAAKFPQLEILSLIGKGGMGAVYKARQKQLDRVVALKILPPGIGDDPAFAGRFAREARALAKLNHPNIVTIHDFGQADGLFFLLMEFVDGMTLRRLLNAGRVAPREALAIVPQICDALQFAHDSGIVHRDIKPENILLDRLGRVKVADFGLAKLIGSEHEPAGGGEQKTPEGGLDLTGVSEAGKIIGTPQYMAPEQRETPGEVDHRADIYALGVVFYQMLTGELPGKPIEVPSKKVHIDVRLDEVVLRALEKKPEMRYQQASMFKTQVETIAQTPAPAQPAKAPGTEAEVNPWQPVLALLGVLFGVTGWILAGELAPPLSTVFLVCSLFVLIVALLKLTGFWPFPPSPLFPKSNWTGRNLPRNRAAQASSMEASTRFSLTAGVGAAWMPFAVAAAAFWISVGIPFSQFNLGAELAIFASLTGFFGSAVLGWVAVSQIRRSGEKLHGMWLAVFDALFFPLLAVDALVFSTVVYVTRSLPYSPSLEVARTLMPIGLCLLTIGLIAWLDFLIVRRVWRAVNKPQDGDLPTAPPAPQGISPIPLERARWVIIARAVILCMAAAVVGIQLQPAILGIGLVLWGIVGCVCVLSKALGPRRNQDEDLAALRTANQIFDVQAIGVCSAGLLLALINTGLTREWNLFLAVLMGCGIVVCLLRLTGLWPLSSLLLPKPPAADIRQSRKRQLRILCIDLPILIVIFLLIRAFFVQAYWAATDAASPEVPRGSRFLVWKLANNFAPGDLIAYRHDGLVNVGRVVSGEGTNVVVGRNGEADASVPHADILGKVISIYWRSSNGASPMPELLQDSTADIQPDGIVRDKFTYEIVNGTGKPLLTDHFINSDFVHIDKMHDAQGRPVAFQARPGKGNIIDYDLTLNEPVAPGATVAITSEGTETGLVKATGEPGVFEYKMKHWPGYGGETRRVELHRLPPGAELISKRPDDLKEEKVGDHIELRIDTKIPPGGYLEVDYRYRLAENAVPSAPTLSNPWTASLPQGTLSLVAVSQYPWDGSSPWWAPDGSPAKTAPFKDSSGISVGYGENPNQNVRQFVFRADGLPPGSSELEINRGAGAAQQIHGSPPASYYMPTAALPKSDAAFNLMAGIATGEWKKISEFDWKPGEQVFSGFATGVEGVDWSVSFNAPVEMADKSTLIAIGFSGLRGKSKTPVTNADYETRLIVVDKDGREHADGLLQGTTINGTARWSVTFKDLPLDRIKTLRFEARPYTWVEFDNVVLNPVATTTAVPKDLENATRFGPVIERVLNDGAAIKLDSGGLVKELLDLHKDSITESVLAAMAWMEKEHVDALYTTVDGLLGVGVKLKALDNSDWDGLSPAQLRQTLEAVPTDGTPQMQISDGTKFPVTRAFETRDSIIGILQITGYSDNPRRVKLRYKLAQNAAAQSTPTPESLAEPPKLQYFSLHQQEGFRPQDAWCLLTAGFTHPDASQDAAAFLQLLDAKGNQVEPNGHSIGSDWINCLTLKSGWITCDQAVFGDEHKIKPATVRLAYAMGPWETKKDIPADSTGPIDAGVGVTLTIGTRLTDALIAAGMTTVTITSSRAAVQIGSQFNFAAILKDGSEAGHTSTEGFDFTTTLHEKFEFPVNLDSVKSFRLLTRPIKTIEFKNVSSQTVAQTPVAPQTPNTAAGATKENPFVNSLGMKFVPVPGTKVLFGIWDTRVQDYRVYADTNPGVDASWKDPGFKQGEDHPVVNVSWNDAKAFCALLTQKERKEGVIASDQEYRLPTDAEWSAAVGKTKYPWGDQWPPPKGAGNYSPRLSVDEYENTSPVGSFKANEYGLYDMGGNVPQWCEDWIDRAKTAHVNRGNVFWSGGVPQFLLSSYRGFGSPGARDVAHGFRCVLASAPQAAATQSVQSPAPSPAATHQ